MFRGPCPAAALLLFCASAAAQVIEFESGGLKYQTLTRGGVTLMFAHLPSHVREYSIVQVAVSNGSGMFQTIRPEDFKFQRIDGAALQGEQAGAVVAELIAKATRNDVIRLVSTYELSLYGMQRFQSTSGYEQRRQSALAEVSSAKLKAAAAASAIALVPTRLPPGQSTDGAVFFRNAGKPLGSGRLLLTLGKLQFDFRVEAAQP